MAGIIASDPAPIGRLQGGERFIRGLLPGGMLCLFVTGLAWVAEQVEILAFGRAWLEWLVLAIILGTLLRTCWRPPAYFAPGIGFVARRVLEVAVVLLGASLDAQTVAAGGFALIAGIALVVLVTLALGYSIGRVLGLSHRLAILVAAGNAICGNSAIAAVAPVLGAKSADVTASIAFTAVLGVVVVLVLPLLVPLLHLSDLRYGVLAGLTVYAVPQVLAATAPVSAVSLQIGTLVKLVRVAMLAPVILLLACLGRQGSDAKIPLRGLLPWFILGFFAMALARSLGLLPPTLQTSMSSIATLLTVLSMAALGLGVDIRTVVESGLRVCMAAIGSLLSLGLISLGLIMALSLH